MVEIIRGRAHALGFPQLVEAGGHLALAGHQRAHDARLKVHAQGRDLVIEQALGRGAVQQSLQDGGGRVQLLNVHLARIGLGQAEQVQQRVAGHVYVQRGDQPVLQAELQQPLDPQTGVIH